MSLSVETLAVARKYTDDSLAGAGAVAGVPCKIQSITAITGGNRVTFLWTDNNGDDHISAMDVMNGVDGEDGKGIQSVSVNTQNHLIITYTDGTTVDAGQIEIHSSVDSVNGQTGAVVLDAEDVGALPDNTPIPSKTSDLTNDSGFATTSDVSTALADYTKTADLTTLLAAKQDTLTFDNAPAENSNNPVKSGGVYAANQTLTNNVDVLFETGVKNICPPYLGSSSYNGITYIGNSDGTVTVNGTCSANTGVNIRVYLKAGQYKVSGCPRGGSYSTYRIGVTTDSWTLIGTHDHGNGTTITIPSDGYYRINLDVREGYVANNLVFKPMITDVDTPESDYDHYVPYAKTNQQLTQDSVSWDDLSEVGAVNYLPNTATSQTIYGVAYTVNSDGSITVDGTATGGNASLVVNMTTYLKKGTYKLTGAPEGYKNITRLSITRGAPSNVFDNGNGATFTLTEDATNALYVQAIVWEGKTVDNLTFYPMITPVSYNGDYVPYAKTNRELTDDVAVKSSEITVNTTNVDSENIARNYVNKSAGVKVLVLQAKPKTNLVAGTTYELGTVPPDYLPTLSTGFVKEDVVTSGGLTALIEVSNGKLKLTPRVNNIPTSSSFIVSVTYI